jgi:glycosyltransferase involved in cell wall biosynthesis
MMNAQEPSSVTAQGQAQPLISIIIPAKNAENTIGVVLRAVRKSSYPRYEIILSDDYSTDGTVQIAEQAGVRVIRSTAGSGANHARNVGAANSSGDILVFIDADIVIARDTLATIVESLGDGIADAVVGIYTAKHRHESFVSQYKNLWVRYSYLKSPPAIDWMFGAISGIRRRAFESIGGFDENLLASNGHDDIELGKRLAKARIAIVLNLDCEVEHLKQYTLRSFFLNEFRRSAGFAELAARLGEWGSVLRRGFANVSPVFILSVIISVIISLMFLAAFTGWLPLRFPLIVMGCYLLLNIRFLNYLEQVRGLFAMIAMIPLLFLDHLFCFFGSVAGVLHSLTPKEKG